MSSLGQMLERFKPKPADVVGIDIGSTGTKVVRLQKHGTEITLAAAEILGPVALAGKAAPAPEAVPALNLPARLRGRYGALALTADTAVVKILTFPGPFDDKAEEKVVESMGVENPDAYRIAYKVVSEGHGRSESRVLAVAMPDELARLAPRLLPSGWPVPFSTEVSALAALSAFLHAQGERNGEQAVGVFEFGAAISTLAIFNKRLLTLIRRFSIGTYSLIAKVRERLGVDEETARNIMADGSFDISQPVNEVLEPLVKQLIVSRDFVERRENCRIARIYVSGGLALASHAMDEIRASMEVEVVGWNPLEGVRVAKGALPDGLSGREWQLAGAVGAALAILEET
jgi:Tfp pilus assembly PilM family ATPase